MVDFDLQVRRPEMPRMDAHENRFEPFQRDPLICTNTRKSPKIYFDQQISRNEKAYQSQMSDPLFELKHMDLVKARTKGILHFSQMKPQQLNLSLDKRKPRITLEPIVLS